MTTEYLGDELQTLVLERLKYGVSYRATAEAIARADVEVVADIAAQELRILMTNRILADRVLEDEQTVYVDVNVPIEQRYWKWGFIPATRTVTHGSVVPATVRAEYFRTFPEAAPRYYPEDLGRGYRYVRYSQSEA